jgi:hypothetical protein
MMLNWVLPETQSSKDLNIFRFVLRPMPKLVVRVVDTSVHSTAAQVSAWCWGSYKAQSLRIGLAIVVILKVEE